MTPEYSILEFGVVFLGGRGVEEERAILPTTKC